VDGAAGQLGGVLVGLGMMVAGLSPVHFEAGAFPYTMTLGFGLMTGSGIGLAYASATPAAVKWFAASKKGSITGVVVGGFGLASVYTAPLTTYLIRTYSVSGTFTYLGIGFLAAIVVLAQVLNNPPVGFVPPGAYAASTSASAPRAAAREYTWREMVRTPSFYALWAMYAFAAFAGLMIIGHMAKIATLQLGATTATTMSYLLVATLAVGNFAGRPFSGLISDRIGRHRTMLGVFLLQAVMMLVLARATTVPLLLGAAAIIGFSYGSNLTLFPATTYDFFGTKNGGVNYGLVFTAWGVGGVFGSQVAAAVVDASKTAALPAGSYSLAYVIAAVLCVLAAAMTLVSKPPDDAPSGAMAEPTRPAAMEA
jgi:OFA family oxalate/formate antiporter-like MFS transporter